MDSKEKNAVNSEILVAGAGFAGSLTALCLQQCGFDVCLVERDRHPRFAIGESSTPIADMILRDLADRYSLPWLRTFSRYGSWQNHYPEITCGLKRGFSYYKHQKGNPFSTDHNHENELLVAASSSDENSDTNWLRSDFDAFLVEKVREYDILYFDQTEIKSVEWNDNHWSFRASTEKAKLKIYADFFIDATGSSALLGELFGISSKNDEFLTNSRAIYSHFEGVKRWSEQLLNLGVSNREYPYNPDHSALHQLISEGWLWMLRFNNERTSMGIVFDQNRNTNTGDKSPEEEWETVISSYPSIRQLLNFSYISAEPGKLISTGRMQRKLSNAVGDHWAALPHTAGFVDPLHSTGIAHTLSGVEEVVELLAKHWQSREQLTEGIRAYEDSVFKELEFIDHLIAGCYQAGDDFELFSTWTMLYFIAAISYEQKRLKGIRPDSFLSAGNPAIREIVHESYADLQNLFVAGPPGGSEVQKFRDQIKQRIAPYNIAGLLDPEARNMYHHTVAEL
ncbi:tryptophan 7-halogenase [Aliifodinibius sp. S!AR15-10]|uniref:NAD(P)/FAD-dependent oxidoreductase n=1 Tax=Aliifodinibius sp. S!AR15-10 TaxID=2950437 RepID=UPI002865F14E|nr:tryptophan 7-halogenase [Aliifodinibius sp. S!AR15-10]MDR8391844.1 tryptophan 7-halogenase [Aliifodinibius sp. S!AR15-10]